MALRRYNPEREKAPPVASLNIHQDDVQIVIIPTTHGDLSIRQRLVTSVSLTPHSKAGSYTPSNCTKKNNSLPQTFSGEKSSWRSNQCPLPDTSKISNNKTMRARSHSPQQSSEVRPSAASWHMKRSASMPTFAVRKPSKKKGPNDFYDVELLKDSTGTKPTLDTEQCITYLYLIVIMLAVTVMIPFILATWFDIWFPSRSYKHPELLINITGLQLYLTHNYFSQTHAINSLNKLLQDEFAVIEHDQPLILSFHGGPGVGKTFLADTIAVHLFVSGLESPCVHKFISSLHITDYSHETNCDVIKWFINQSVYKHCPLELFIIDNAELLTPGLVTCLLHENERLFSDPRVHSSVVIFTSTLGEDEIFKMGYCAEESCYSRTILRLTEVLQSWKAEETNDQSNTHNIIESIYVLAFFPLQREHVKLCARRILEHRFPLSPITDSLLESVANEVSFTLADDKEYSIAGCKKVAEKVSLHV